MSVDELYEPVAHKHYDCPICTRADLIHDITPVYTCCDRLLAAILDMQTMLLVKIGKRIEVKEG